MPFHMICRYHRKFPCTSKFLRKRNSGPQRGFKPRACCYGKRVEFLLGVCNFCFLERALKHSRKIFYMFPFCEIWHDSPEARVERYLRRNNVRADFKKRLLKAAATFDDRNSGLVAGSFNRENCCRHESLTGRCYFFVVTNPSCAKANIHLMSNISGEQFRA